MRLPSPLSRNGKIDLVRDRFAENLARSGHIEHYPER
jgi:hypothetical protein